MKNLIFKSVLFTFLAFLISNVTAADYITLQRTLDACNKNRCSYVDKRLCSFIVSENESITGWCIDCSGNGNTLCPKRPTSTGPDLDIVDLNASETLIEYADDQVESGNTSGWHTINIQVTGEPSLRIYKITWSIAVSANDEWTGEMKAERIQ